jgi:hypothetical protein
MGLEGWRAVAAAAEVGCKELETVDGVEWKVGTLTPDFTPRFSPAGGGDGRGGPGVARRRDGRRRSLDAVGMRQGLVGGRLDSVEMAGNQSGVALAVALFLPRSAATLTKLDMR